MKFNQYLCKSCSRQATTQNGSPACSYHKCLIDLENDFCSWHTSLSNSYTCPICGQKKKQKEFYVYPFDDKVAIICQDCAPHMSSCLTCDSKDKCDFQNDHSEPPVVMKTIQQGMMMMQVQVKNPKLIVKHCQKCRCSDGADPSMYDITCFKESDETMCPNWRIQQTLLQ